MKLFSLMLCMLVLHGSLQSQRPTTAPKTRPPARVNLVQHHLDSLRHSLSNNEWALGSNPANKILLQAKRKPVPPGRTASANDCGYFCKSMCTTALDSAKALLSPLCPGGTTNLVAYGIKGYQPQLLWWTGPNGTGTLLGQGDTLKNVGIGVYYARLTANCGDIQEKRVEILQAVNNMTASITKTDVTCNGLSNGSATVTAANGQSPYLYKLDTTGTTFQSPNVFSGLRAGVYSVSYRDIRGCIGSGSVTIAQPARLSATTRATAVTCNGAATGTITVTVTGGTPPYLYRSGNGANQTSNVFTGLKAGNYRIFYQDAKGCTGFTNIITIAQPPLLVVNTTATQVTCFNTATGTITATASGGIPPYRYRNGSGTAQTSGIFSGLRTGNYRIYVSDSNQCTAFSSLITITQPLLLSATFTVVNATCATSTNGSLTVSASGGTPPYQYMNGPAGVYQSSGTFSNLKPGNYRIYYRDANGCSAFTSLITVGPSPLVASFTLTQPTCNGAADGTIATNVVGGTPPYEYKLGNGTYKTLGVFTGLRAGNYRVYVIDANGCSAFTTVASLVNPANTCITTAKTAKTPAKATDKLLSAELSPNPSPHAFILTTHSTNVKSPVYVRVVDAAGKVMQQLTTRANQSNRFGADLSNGVYIIEVKQDEQVQLLKAVKLR